VQIPILWLPEHLKIRWILVVLDIPEYLGLPELPVRLEDLVGLGNQFLPHLELLEFLDDPECPEILVRPLLPVRQLNLEVRLHPVFLADLEILLFLVDQLNLVPLWNLEILQHPVIL
jgi:hypothetical protein